jgi:hypothetical protein
VYATGVRGVIVLAMVAACDFAHGVAQSGDAAPPDMAPDVVVASWQIDSMSGKAVPAAVFEWDGLIKAHGVPVMAPDHVWLMQETSFDLQDSIANITLGPVASPLYRQPVVGWSRRAVGTNDTLIHQGFYTDVIGNLNGTSYLLLLYVAVSPSTFERTVFGIGKMTDHRYVTMTTTPVFKGTGYNVTPTVGTMNPMSNVHPIVLQIDPTKSKYVVYTDQERLAVNWTATGGMGNLLMIGNATEAGAAPARYLYGALWRGTNAELDDAAIKKLLQAMGWTVTGY